MDEGMIDAMPARSLQAMMGDLLPTFLPESQRRRFEANAARWSTRTPFEWDDMFFARRDELIRLLEKLSGWLEIEEWDLALEAPACDEDLLLLYVLKVQSAAARVMLLSPDQYVPGDLVQMWSWLTRFVDGETWLFWTVMLDGMPIKLPLWTVPRPREI